MGRNVVETIVGALVLVVAGIFTAYAFTHSGTANPKGYELVARFDRVDGIKRGSDVTLAGVKVGTVTSIELDRETFWPVVRLSVEDRVRVPSESVAKVVSEGLLGGSVVLIDACCDPKDVLKPGAEFTKTQGYRSIVELLLAAVMGGVNADGQKK